MIDPRDEVELTPESLDDIRAQLRIWSIDRFGRSTEQFEEDLERIAAESDPDTFFAAVKAVNEALVDLGRAMLDASAGLRRARDAIALTLKKLNDLMKEGKDDGTD